MTTMSQTELPNLNNELLLSGLMHIFNTHVESILKNISEEYNLNLDNLRHKYIDNNEIDLNVFNKKRARKKNKVVKKEELCMARKADMQQCTRRRKPGSEFCGKHCGCLKHGRIDDSEEYTDNDKFIKCQLTNIEGKDYLIDNNNMIYTTDVENPFCVGRLSNNGTIEFMQELQINTD